MSKSTSITDLLSFIFFLCLVSSNAIAASFDCTQAKTNMEKAICNDSSLSELDEKLGSEYKTARLKLSPPADKAFVASQRSWLRFHSTYCFIDVNASSVTQAEAIRCLASAYKDRIEDLKKTGHLIGGFKTYTVIDHHLRSSKAKQTVYVIERKFIQVDDETPLGHRLNTYLSFKDKADLPDDRGTENYDIKLTHVTPDWLYKQIESEIFTGAYPTSDTECGLYSISKERPLKISDVFQGHAWQNIFESSTKKHFTELAKREKEFDITMVHDFRPSALEPSSPFRFCLSQNGVELSGFLPHVVRAFDGVTIDWKLLENVMTPYAQAQIKKWATW